MKKFIFYFIQKKFLLINFLIFSYIFLNLLDGNRGYFSYVSKNEILRSKIIQERKLSEDLSLLKIKNSMLVEKNLNLDFLDQLYREYFTVGKKGEKIYLNK